MPYSSALFSMVQEGVFARRSISNFRGRDYGAI
jgi:hypothetical protein